MTKTLITALPLGEGDRVVLVQCANATFETVLARMELSHDAALRSLWSADTYVATLLSEDMLPIERDEALGMIEAFLVHHVVDLIAEADTLATTYKH